MSDTKVIEEFRAYLKFKEKLEYISPEIVEQGGVLYCDGLPILDGDGKDAKSETVFT